MIPQIRDGNSAAEAAELPAELQSEKSADSGLALSRHETDLHDAGGAASSSEGGEEVVGGPPPTSEQETAIIVTEAQLALLKKDEQALQQKMWKANKAERKVIDAKILSLQARIKGLTRKLEKARAVAELSQADVFDRRLEAREAGELEGSPTQAQDAVECDDTSRIYLDCASLIFLEVDGVVSALAGGFQDELMRRLKEVVLASSAKLVVTSQWRRNTRLMRMLDVALGKLDMPKIEYKTGLVSLQEQQTHGIDGPERMKVYEIRKFLKRCGGGGICGVPWLVLDTVDLGGGTWLEKETIPASVAQSAKTGNPSSRRGVHQSAGGSRAKTGESGADLGTCAGNQDAEPLDSVHFVRVEGVHGLSPGLAARGLNCLRFQAVGLIRANNLSLCTRGPQDAEVAFAMGTHHRLGKDSPVGHLRRNMTDYLRIKQGPGRRGGTEALRAILSKHISVPGDFDTLHQAVAGGACESHLTLHITLGEGTHVLTEPLRPPRGCRIVIRSALLSRSEVSKGGGRAGLGIGGLGGGWKCKLAARGVDVHGGDVQAKLGGGGGRENSLSGLGHGEGGIGGGGVGAEVFGVKLVVYGGKCAVSVKDDDFVKNPFSKGNHPAMAQSHVTLEGITLEALLLDREAFTQDYVYKLEEENKMKETRGLYRRLLIAQGIFVSADEADRQCPSIEAAKALLAKHALEEEISRLRRRQPKEQSLDYMHSAPRLVESLEGSVTLHRCMLKSEVGIALYCARTGVVSCRDCKVADCRGSGLVVGQGGVVEFSGGEVKSCRGYGGIAVGGSKLQVLSGAVFSNNMASGLGANGGGLVHVEGARILENAECGISSQEGSSIVVRQCTISANGSGIVVQDRATAEVSDSEISRNKQAGITASMPGTTLSLSGSKVVRNGGSGCSLLKFAEAVLSSSTLSGNGGAGFLASEQANATITDSELRSNEQHGMMAQAGACITARSCLLKLNLGAGAVAALSGSKAGVIGGEVVGNRVGLVAMDGAVVAEADGCTISDNKDGPEMMQRGGKVLHPAARPQSVVAVPDPTGAQTAGRRR